MQYELDLIGRTAQGTGFLVYVTVEGKKLCIGQLMHSNDRAMWTAFANGNELAAVKEEIEGVSKLWDYYCIRHPLKAGKRTRPIRECTVEERFYRVRRKIPRHKSMPDLASVAEQLKLIPIHRREPLRDELDELIYDLQSQLMLWRKVRHELDKTPAFTLYINDTPQ